MIAAHDALAASIGLPLSRLVSRGGSHLLTVLLLRRKDLIGAK